MILASDWNADVKPDIAFVEGGGGGPTIDVLTNTTGGVSPSLGIASLSLNPTTVTGGNSSTGTVTLTVVAQAATTVAVASNNAGATSARSREIIACA
jgi:hypothetical protein